MTPTKTFAFACSEATGWAAVAKELEAALHPISPLEEGVERLGFLYITDVLAEDYASLLAYLRQTTGITHWTGSVGAGICWHRGASIGGSAIGA
ncbi:MAG: hypothetical protein JKY95_13380, partial [Planctomycetaceae bacterium]|nr:hypothetical protein [Planctomycetaceae bacterium]